MQRSSAQGSSVAVARPLYGQVREILLERISRGDWAPGDTLPNEFLLATEFGVSIGTLRRAIEGLEDAGLLIRRQGRGTYVAGSHGRKANAKFVALREPSGEIPSMTFQVVQFTQREMTPIEAKRLQLSLPRTADLVEQTIRIGSRTIGFERVLLQRDRIPGIEEQLSKGHDLQSIYANQGLTIIRALDHVDVEVADDGVAALLKIAFGTPLLRIDRIAFGIDQRPIESRRSVFLTDAVSYASEIDRP